jgi:hypothetical protein
MRTLTQVYNFRLHLHKIIMQKSGFSIYIPFNGLSEAVWSYDLTSRLLCKSGTVKICTASYSIRVHMVS